MPPSKQGQGQQRNSKPRYTAQYNDQGELVAKPASSPSPSKSANNSGKSSQKSTPKSEGGPGFASPKQSDLGPKTEPSGPATWYQNSGNQKSSILTAPSGPLTGYLLGEFVLGVVVIIWQQFSRDNSYEDKMSEMLWRLTALTGVFFILALMASSAKASKVAAAFGLLIDLGILYNATSDIKDMFNVASGQGIGSTVQLVSDTKVDPPPHNILGGADPAVGTTSAGGTGSQPNPPAPTLTQ